jgi:hypothetical protein
LSQEQYFKDIAEIPKSMRVSLSGNGLSQGGGFLVFHDRVRNDHLLEDAYGVSVDPDRFSSLNTLGDLYSWSLRRCLRNRRGK